MAKTNIADLSIKLNADAVEFKKNMKDAGDKMKGLSQSSSSAFSSMKEQMKAPVQSLKNMMGDLGGVQGQLGGMLFPVRAVGTAIKTAFSIGPIGAVMAAITACTAPLAAFFSRTEEGGNSLKIVMSGIKGGWNAIMDVLSQVGRAMFGLITLDFSELKAGINGAASAMSNVVSKTREAISLAKELIDINKIKYGSTSTLTVEGSSAKMEDVRKMSSLMEQRTDLTVKLQLSVDNAERGQLQEEIRAVDAEMRKMLQPLSKGELFDVQVQKRLDDLKNKLLQYKGWLKGAETKLEANKGKESNGVWAGEKFISVKSNSQANVDSYTKSIEKIEKDIKQIEDSSMSAILRIEDLRTKAAYFKQIRSDQSRSVKERLEAAKAEKDLMNAALGMSLSLSDMEIKNAYKSYGLNDSNTEDSKKLNELVLGFRREEVSFVSALIESNSTLVALQKEHNTELNKEYQLKMAIDGLKQKTISSDINPFSVDMPLDNYDEVIENASSYMSGYITDLTDKSDAYCNTLGGIGEKISEITSAANAELSNLMSNTMIGLADGLGGIIGGDMGLDGLLNVVLEAFSSFLKKIGSELIVFGTTMAAFKVALKNAFANPYAAIAVGAAMVITASIMSAQIKKNAESGIPKLANGGLAYGPTYAMIGDNRNAHIDPEVVAPLSKLKSIIGNQNGVNSGTVVFKIGGRDLVGILNKENNINSRF